MNYYSTNYTPQTQQTYGSGYLNPMAQNQLQQTMQNSNINMQQMPQPQQQPTQQIELLKGRRVTTIEEARACSFELDGSVSYFPSTDGKSIFTKQLNLDGTVSILEYKIVPGEEAKPTAKGESYDTLQEELKTVKGRLEELEKKTGDLIQDLCGKQ